MRVDRRVRETIALDRASKRSGIRRKTGSDTVFRSRVPFGKEGKTGDGIMAIAVAGARQLMKANVSGGGGCGSLPGPKYVPYRPIFPERWLAGK